MLRFTQFGLDHAAEAVFWIDRDAKFIYVNEAAERLLGYEREELLACTIFDLDPNDSISVWETRRGQLRDQGEQSYESTFYKKDGQAVPMQIAVNLIEYEEQEYICCIAHDISERKKAQEEKEKLEAYLRQTQKTEAIGTLAGGIAHDFNNILSAIIGYAELAMMKVPRDSELADDLEEIYQAGERARDLVKQILTFSRQSERTLEPMKVSETIDEALKLLRASLPATIEVRREIQSDALIMGDATQIHQIVMNLCTNSAHAMRERGGVLEIGLTNVELDSDFVSGHPDLLTGPYLNLTVSDTGQGMSPETLQRVFDPFFTTKDKEEGTGMGLSVVHGIVKSHGGAIYTYSEPGKGSSFRVFLPAIERRHQPEKRAKATVPSGNENILFVDDERALANMGKEMLEGLGYHVSTETSSLDALELFRRQPDRFDLVVTDMTMPKMTGDELAQELIAVRSDVPIILCTGFSTRITEERAKKIGIRALVMKPIIRRDLANTVRSVLVH
jgi:PAS domain S-box-containing protein